MNILNAIKNYIVHSESRNVGLILFVSYSADIETEQICAKLCWHLTKYIYVIYRIGGPYREIFLEVLKTARGRRPREVFKTERNISLYGPTIPVNNIFIFF
jgi:hypothetical protein